MWQRNVFWLVGWIIAVGAFAFAALLLYGVIAGHGAD
jgi:hypothetical protein